jgi:hypothetical protein
MVAASLAKKLVGDPYRYSYRHVDPTAALRAMFERELAERGLTSLMPAEAYTNPDYVWT